MTNAGRNTLLMEEVCLKEKKAKVSFRVEGFRLKTDLEKERGRLKSRGEKYSSKREEDGGDHDRRQ